MAGARALEFDDFIKISQRKKIIPFINTHCIGCLEEMSEVIYEFVDNDVNMIFSGVQEKLLALKSAGDLMLDREESETIKDHYSNLYPPSELMQKAQRYMQQLNEQAVKDGKANPEFTFSETIYPLDICSEIKPTAEYIRDVMALKEEGVTKDYIQSLISNLFMVPKLMVSNTLESNLATNIACNYLYSKEKDYEKVDFYKKSPDYIDADKLLFLEKRLKIAYSDDINIEDYLDIFDTNITASMRKILNNIAKEQKLKNISYITLQNKINEYNEGVNDIISRTSKRAKITYAISDIIKSNTEALKLFMTGISEKYLGIPEKSWECFGIPQKYRTQILTWMNNRSLWIEAGLLGVSPEILHLYRTRTCLKEFK